MNRPSRFPAALTALTIMLTLVGCSGDPDSAGTHEDSAAEVAKTTLIHVGDPAPEISCELLDGGRFELKDQRDKVVLVNFFATWCGPCIAEMPHLRSQVWERFKGADFVMVSIAREESASIVAPFAAKHELTWPVALDQERAVYGRYAEAYIPRNFVIDREGVVVYEAQGFEEKEFEAMVALLSRELGGS